MDRKKKKKAMRHEMDQFNACALFLHSFYRSIVSIIPIVSIVPIISITSITSIISIISIVSIVSIGLGDSGWFWVILAGSG